MAEGSLSPWWQAAKIGLTDSVQRKPTVDTKVGKMRRAEVLFTKLAFERGEVSSQISLNKQNEVQGSKTHLYSGRWIVTEFYVPSKWCSASVMFFLSFFTAIFLDKSSNYFSSSWIILNSSLLIWFFFYNYTQLEPENYWIFRKIPELIWRRKSNTFKSVRNYNLEYKWTFFTRSMNKCDFYGAAVAHWYSESHGCAFDHGFN